MCLSVRNNFSFDFFSFDFCIFCRHFLLFWFTYCEHKRRNKSLNHISATACFFFYYNVLLLLFRRYCYENEIRLHSILPLPIHANTSIWYRLVKGSTKYINITSCVQMKVCGIRWQTMMSYSIWLYNMG